jgi:exosome complex RNA-binding protein Rrp4
MFNTNEKMQLVKMLLGFEEKTTEFKTYTEAPKKQIVIAQRGWVFIGMVQKDNSNITIKEASVIRNWGTTKGLGELAKNGPIKDKTVLDACPDITIHELSIVARINCEF